MLNPGRLRAAQYLRMSTDAQDLSPEIQAKAIHAYAEQNNIDVVETYLDAGRSGLSLVNRPAMKRLLNDVVADDCVFSVILVYDVSRWGRFQDTDASAYHEYHCRLHGVQVRYVQEPFASVDTPMGGLLKSLKRAMAAEYSRELAVKTRSGQQSALEGGYHMGTLPCLGIRRVACAADGTWRSLGLLEHKSATREHVRWIRGPADEVKTIQRIFDLYTQTNLSIQKIAEILRGEAITASTGKQLTRSMLYSLMASETVVGNFVWGRRDAHKRPRSELHEKFCRVENCIDPIVSSDLWNIAKRKRSKRAGTVRTRDELLAALAQEVRKNPRLTASCLQSGLGPSRGTYVKHFGSFAAALACIGLSPATRDKAYFAHLRNACRIGKMYCLVAQHLLQEHGVRCVIPQVNGHSLLVNGNVRVRLQPIWQAVTYSGMRWSLKKIYREPFDHVLIIRLRKDDTAMDSILLSRKDYFAFPLWFPDALPSGTFQNLGSEAEVAKRFSSLACNFVQGEDNRGM